MDNTRGALNDRAFGTQTAMLRKQSVIVDPRMSRRTSGASTLQGGTLNGDEEDPERGLGAYDIS